jgi:hypothetical protein
MKTVSKIITVVFISLPLSAIGCQTGENKNVGVELGANSVAGQAQRTSGLATFGRPSHDSAKTESVSAAATKPVVAAQVASPTKNDPCKVVAKSAKAVGLPCLTTVKFVKSLRLTPAQQKKALAGVQRADRKLGKKAAH